ncbi:MAG: sulfurtransferase complex subunit TusB [Gammaproteobacteria bacterium]|nr:sulfurtransferase complex subunit TusB [Gammaproteobacteria bacterium]
MTTLHILNTSPTASTQFSSCLRLISAGDAILLTGEAVQALRDGSVGAQALSSTNALCRLYALEDDVQARGIDTTHIGVTVIDYPAFVALCVEHTRVNSWT